MVLRSIWIMLGALDGYDVKPRVFSYEGAFWGRLLYSRVLSQWGGKSRVKGLYKQRQSKISKQRKNEDVYVGLRAIP